MTARVEHSLYVPVLLLALFTSAVGQKKQTVFAVLVDNTGSMTRQFPQVLMFADAVLKRIHQRGPASVFKFERKDPFAVIGPGTDWSQDEAILRADLHDLSIINAPTALFEAIEAIAFKLTSKANSDTGVYTEKVLIVITDGDDRATGTGTSSRDEEDRTRRARDKLIKKLKETGVKVYAIGLTKQLSADSLIRMSARERAELFLTKVAKETGGRVIFPKSKQLDTDAALNDLLGP
jgi:hypothetical protein